MSFDDSDFHVSYLKLGRLIVDHLIHTYRYSGSWCIQRYPTVRFHLPGNISVFEFHRDSDYKHPFAEVNCFYALTQCKSSSSLHVERNLGLRNFFPLDLDAGEYSLLNTSVFAHGDLVNSEPNTRISFDFRFVPLECLDSLDHSTSLSSARIFSEHDYFLPLA